MTQQLRVPFLVRCAPLSDRRARNAADLQYRLARFRRAAAQQRARHRRRAGNAGGLHALFELPAFDPRSPLITGLSLSLLLRADDAWLHALAGVIAHRLEIPASASTASTSGIPPASRSWCCCSPSNGVWISPGAVGLDRVVRGAARLLRHPRAARGAPLRHRDLLSRQPRRAAAGARLCGSAIRSPSRCISCRAARC